MAIGIKKHVTLFTKDQFEALKNRARELEALMEENEQAIILGLENIKSKLQKELGWAK